MLSRDVAACSDFIASMHTPSSHEGEADNNKGCSLVLHPPPSILPVVVVDNEIIVQGSGKRVASVLVLGNFILTLLAIRRDAQRRKKDEEGGEKIGRSERDDIVASVESERGRL